MVSESGLEHHLKLQVKVDIVIMHNYTSMLLLYIHISPCCRMKLYLLKL